MGRAGVLPRAPLSGPRGGSTGCAAARGRFDGFRQFAKVEAISLIMPESARLEQMVEDGWTLEVSRFPDAPLGASDRLLLADLDRGSLLIARAPIRIELADRQTRREFLPPRLGHRP